MQVELIDDSCYAFYNGCIHTNIGFGARVWYDVREVRKLERSMQKQIIVQVYDALKEKGYNPLGQIVGYILTEDPTYITNHNGARKIISSIDRDELLKDIVASYLGTQ